MYVLQRSLRRADALAATAHSRHGLSQHRRKKNNKKSPLNRGKAPVHATRPGMLRGRDLAVTLVSCAAPFARARAPPNARRSRPEMGARRTRSGDAQPRSARARNRGRKIKRKKHRHLSVQKPAPDFHRFSTFFHDLFVARLIVAFLVAVCLVLLPPPSSPRRGAWASAGEGCAGDASR